MINKGKFTCYEKFPSFFCVFVVYGDGKKQRAKRRKTCKGQISGGGESYCVIVRRMADKKKSTDIKGHIGVVRSEAGKEREKDREG